MNTATQLWLLLAAGLWLSFSAQAQTLVLDCGTLPSAQGWTYVGQQNEVNGSGVVQIPEASVFSIQAGVLHQDSSGVAFRAQGENDYYNYDVVRLPAQPFILTTRLRMITDSSPPNNPFGFAIWVRGGGHAVCVAFGSGKIVVGKNNQLAPLEYSQYHDYRLEGDLRSDTFRFFIDDQWVATGIQYTDMPLEKNEVVFGDSTGGAYAVADVASFRFVQLAFALRQADAEHVELSWYSETNRLYQVQWTPSLAPPAWTNWGAAVPGNGSRQTALDVMAGQPARFYRMLISP